WPRLCRHDRARCLCGTDAEGSHGAHSDPGSARRWRTGAAGRAVATAGPIAASACSGRAGGAAGAMSGGHLIGAFLEMMSAERGAAANTIDAYRRDLSDYAGFVSSRGETLQICRRDTVEAYLTGLKRQGLAASSSARRLSDSRQFHKFLCADGLRGDDPTRIVASPRSSRALPKVLSVAEVDRLLQTAEAEANEAEDDGPLRLYVMLELLYATGLRVSELVALKRGAVMRDTGFITVVGKGRKERIVPLTDRARDAVRNWIERLPPGQMLFPAGGESGHVARQVFARDLK